jgi:hypothetical protein
LCGGEKLNRKILAIAAIAVLVMVPVTYALLTFKVTLPASVIINPASASIQVLDTSEVPLTALDFGSTRQNGGVATCTVIIKNTGELVVTLNMTANNISTDPPPMGMHGDYLTWNSEGAQVNPGSSITATFTYRINMMVAGHNVPRNFDVILTATEVS